MKFVNLRKLALLAIDAATLVLSCITAFFLCSAMTDIVFLTTQDTYLSIVLFTLCNLLGLYIVGAYRNIWRYANVKNFLLLFWC